MRATFSAVATAWVLLSDAFVPDPKWFKKDAES